MTALADWEDSLLQCKTLAKSVRAVVHVVTRYCAERKRNEFNTTNTDENAIAADASMGFSRPAIASGIIATL